MVQIQVEAHKGLGTIITVEGEKHAGILHKSKVWIHKIKEYDTKLFTTNNWTHVSIKYAF